MAVRKIGLRARHGTSELVLYTIDLVADSRVERVRSVGAVGRIETHRVPRVLDGLARKIGAGQLGIVGNGDAERVDDGRIWRRVPDGSRHPVKFPVPCGFQRQANGADRPRAAIGERGTHFEGLTGHDRRHVGGTGAERPRRLRRAWRLRHCGQTDAKRRVEGVRDLQSLELKRECDVRIQILVRQRVAGRGQSTRQRRGRRGRIGDRECPNGRLDLAVDDRQRRLHARRSGLADQAIQSREGGVDPVEERLFLRRRIDGRLQPFVVRERGAWLRAEAAAVLRALKAEAEPRQ